MNQADRTPLVVLLHSPVASPATWAPAAAELQGAGLDVVVPSLLDVTQQPPPSAPVVVAGVQRALTHVAESRPLIIVMHSNAGHFAGHLAADLHRPIHRLIFADASIPPPHGETTLVPPGFLSFLRKLSEDGVLPPWSTWWDADEVAALFPDEATMRAFRETEPQVPLAYYEQVVSVPPGWSATQSAYLRFSKAYVHVAEDATRRGWPVETLPGGHLHMLVDPAGVAAAIRRLAGG